MGNVLILVFQELFANINANQELVRQHAYNVLITTNHASFHLLWHQKVSKYYDHDCRGSTITCYIWLICFEYYIIRNILSQPLHCLWMAAQTVRIWYVEASPLKVKEKTQSEISTSVYKIS